MVKCAEKKEKSCGKKEKSCGKKEKRLDTGQHC
jgi:hypothetical protein